MNLVIDSKFRPFTFDEMVKPLMLYKQEYDKVEQDYSDLIKQTEMWKDIANREKSPIAYEMYNRYSNDLAAVAESFSRGMNINNRRALLGMKRRYAQDITPIAQASEAMKAANDLRDKLGSDAIFEVGRYNSLDDFLHGKTANNKYESRKDIATRTAALAQATAQSILEDPIIKSSMSPQFLEIIQKRGLGSLDELQAAIAGNPAAANRFAQIKSQMIDQLGGIDRFDAEGRRAVEGAIHEGMFAGLNNYQTSLQQNGEYMTRAQRDSSSRAWSELNFRNEQAAAQAAASAPRAILGDDGKPTGEYYDPKLGAIVDDKGNIIGTPKSKNSLGPQQETPPKRDPNDPRPKEIMAPLYFDAYYNDTSSGLNYKTKWTGNIDEASRQLIYSKGKHITGSGIPNKLSTKALANIREKLPKGMSLNDVDVYVDHDTWNRSHYIVVDARGDILGREKVEGPVTSTSGSKGEQPTGM